MGFSQRRIIFTAFLVLAIMLACATLGEMRALEGEEWLKQLVIQSLPKGQNSPSSPNPCNNIPGRSNGKC
ncbi:hypothetical protein L484_005741 [Morus notabilis]|uniref:Transmembrane protein n=1 Tax=Morus notabilis TaxID=981085 RepID=W9RBP7_9ROSA|nr:hypothetical protein L484_005741 [Morus notabilis]